MEYLVRHINIRKGKRSGRVFKKNTITIHSTANLTSTALNERNWLVSPNNYRDASWNIVVDDKRAVEAIPLNEESYHSSTLFGNMTSIAIEMCESGDRQKTIDNTIEVVVKLLKENGWNTNQLRRHFDWSGKNCPRIFSANNWKAWFDFKKEVQKVLDAKPEPIIVDESEHWSRFYSESLKSIHIVNSYPDGDFKPDNTLTRAELASVVSGILKFKEEL